MPVAMVLQLMMPPKMFTKMARTWEGNEQAMGSLEGAVKGLVTSPPWMIPTWLTENPWANKLKIFTMAETSKNMP